MTGVLFVVSGTIKDKTVYRFYQEDDQGRISLETLESDEVYLVEDGAKQVLSYREGTCNPPEVGSRWWSPWATGGCEQVWDKRVEIHVPEGSVGYEVDVNLPKS